MNVPPCVSAITFVSAAVNVVFPWSTCPIVPTFTCGLLRSNFSLLMTSCPREKSQLLLDDGVGNVGRHFHVLLELHGEGRATLTHGPHGRGVTEHLGQRDFAGDDLARRSFIHACDLPAAAVEVTDDVTGIFLW